MNKQSTNLFKAHWSIPVILAIVCIGLSIGMFIYGWNLKSAGESYNIYWMMSIVSLWGGANYLQKLLKEDK